MSIVNIDYLKLVLLYVYVNSTSQYFGDSDNCIIEYLNHTGPKSKIVPLCSAQTRSIVLYRVRCGVDLPSIVGGEVRRPWPVIQGNDASLF